MEALAEKGLAPEELEADTGYGSGENIVMCAVEGVRLVAPVQDPAAPERVDPRWESVESAPEPAASAERPAPAPEVNPFGLGDFRYNKTFNEITACPGGHAPVHQEVVDGPHPYRATFKGEKCLGCPMAERCPTRVEARTSDRVLSWRDAKAATATRQREQQETAFKEAYKIRSGVESTMGEIKGRHGAGDLRVRHRERVALAMYFKATALNAKRAALYHVKRLREALSMGPMALMEGV